MPRPFSAPRRRVLAVAALSTVGALAASTLPATSASAAAPPSPVNVRTASKILRDAVTPAGVLTHLRALDAIATAHDGTRASGTPGYTASVRYVVAQLRAAGYKPQVQGFSFPFFDELSPATLAQVGPDAATYTNPDDFTILSFSGSGDVTAEVVPVDTDLTPTDDSTSGCEAEDFDGFPAGAVALVQRGTCPFGQKVGHAVDAGASAVLIFNRGTDGFTDSITNATVGAPTTIPVLGTTFGLGRDLGQAAGATVHLTTDTVSENRRTFNVTAETSGGNVKKVVMVGAHLDSVTEGPGINDNGSGSATILEVAKQLAAKGFKPRNKIRFAWWGAEEEGLLGATHYVANLQERNPVALDNIALYLNFDMVGSPNFARFVYDGDNSAFGEEEGAAIAPNGSAGIERDLVRYFTSQRLATVPTAFDGRSDYGPFIAQNIASGGLFSGAEGIKTPAEAELFGGTAGEPYDACYHQACDDLANVNRAAINQMSDGVAHAVAVYGYRIGLPGANNPVPQARAAARAAAKAARPAPRALQGVGVLR